MNEQQQQKLDEILKKHEYKSNLVIAIMQDVQKEYHYPVSYTHLILLMLAQHLK